MLNANRRHFIWQVCLHACKTLHRAKKVTESLSLSLSLSHALSLSILCWSLTKHSLFGSLTLPLRLSHRCGTGVNLPKHLKVYTSRLLHARTHAYTDTQTHKEHKYKHTQAIIIHQGTHLYMYTNAQTHLL